VISSPSLYFWRPAEATRRIRERPLLWPAFSLSSIAGILALVLRWPAVLDAVIRHLPSTAGVEDQEWIRSVLFQDLFLRCTLVPLTTGIKVAGLSSLLFLLARFSPSLQLPRFRVLAVLVTHVMLLQATGEILTHLAGWDTFGTSSPGPPGVAWLVSLPHNYISVSLIRSLNVLTLWYCTALAVGLRVLFRGATLRSCLIAVVAWIVAVLANLWLIRLMHDALHLRV